jgi:hypothetical protein
MLNQVLGVLSPQALEFPLAFMQKKEEEINEVKNINSCT